MTKYNFPTIKRRIDELEQMLNRTRSENGAMRIYNALERQEITITTLLTHINAETEDSGALMGYRRRVRMLKRDALKRA